MKQRILKSEYMYIISSYFKLVERFSRKKNSLKNMPCSLKNVPNNNCRIIILQKKHDIQQ